MSQPNSNVTTLVPLPWLVARVLPGNQLAQIRCESEKEALALYQEWKPGVELLGGSVTVSVILQETIK